MHASVYLVVFILGVEGKLMLGKRAKIPPFFDPELGGDNRISKMRPSKNIELTPVFEKGEEKSDVKKPPRIEGGSEWQRQINEVPPGSKQARYYPGEYRNHRHIISAPLNGGNSKNLPHMVLILFTQYLLT